MSLFSVILPTFNRSSVIERAIDSVLNQSFTDFELIIVDDGSTDKTKTLLDRYDDRIQYVFQENRGVSAARNLGVKQAKGKWLAFLDSDDEWLDKKLELQNKYIQNNPEIKIVHGNEIWIRNGVRVNQMKKHAKGGGDQFLRSLELCLISPSTVALRKDLYCHLGGFHEDFVVCEDYDLWLKITHQYEVGFIEKDLIKKYGGHEDQLSRQFYGMDLWRIKSILSLLKEYTLKAHQKEAALKILNKKMKILEKGALKHENLSLIKELEDLKVILVNLKERLF